MKDLRSNGYTFNPKRVATEEVYDWVMENTNATDFDFERKEIKNSKALV